MGLLTSASFVPGLALGLVAGAWVDRVSRRNVLVAADLASAVALAIVPGAALLDRLEIGQLFVVALLTGTASTFFLVAYRSYLPSVVGVRMTAILTADGTSICDGPRSATTNSAPLIN